MLFVPLYPISPGPRRAHTHAHMHTGSHNHGEHAAPQVLGKQTNEGKNLTHSTHSFFMESMKAAMFEYVSHL